MRFIIMHKTNAHWEAGGIPGPALIARVGELIADLVKSGALQGADGLRPSSEGVRLTLSPDRQHITPGPFQGDNELPAGFSILRTESIDAAIDWAAQQAQALETEETVEIDIRPVTEPWDIGMAPKPESIANRRYMVLRKATPATESGAGPSAAQRTRLSGLIDAATRTGIHLTAETMRPSRRGRRLKNSRDGVLIMDGPFAETKELISGFVIVSADSIDEATRWAERYIRAVGTHEVDVRELE
jgi:hypothetical protein